MPKSAIFPCALAAIAATSLLVGPLVARADDDDFCQPATLRTTVCGQIQTADKNVKSFWWAPDNGGVPGDNVALLDTSADCACTAKTTPFTMTILSGGKTFTLQDATGRYLSATGGGNLGNPPPGTVQQPIRTDSHNANASAGNLRFRIQAIGQPGTGLRYSTEYSPQAKGM